jgi:hypothetical protein
LQNQFQAGVASELSLSDGSELDVMGNGPPDGGPSAASGGLDQAELQLCESAAQNLISKREFIFLCTTSPDSCSCVCQHFFLLSLPEPLKARFIAPDITVMKMMTSHREARAALKCNSFKKSSYNPPII